MGSEWPGLVQGCSQVLGEQLAWIIQAVYRQNETLKPTREEQIQIRGARFVSYQAGTAFTEGDGTPGESGVYL